MNTNKIKAYAPKARRDFIQAVTTRAQYLGLSADGSLPVEIKGDVALIHGHPFTKKEGELRGQLEKRIERDGFDQVMDSVAYTWFNRFMALRFMELHDYLDHGHRVLSNRSGSDIPEILENAVQVDLPGLDREKVARLRLAGNKDNELFKVLITAQCNALHRSMPFLFERINDETELLLPDNLLHTNSAVRKMVTEIPEEDWEEVEIVGWIYQFYISEKKAQVIGKVVAAEDIPAATQLFTPNWIVKYMVQNTLGRKWLATYPESPLRGKMAFYIEPAEQAPDVQAQLDAVTPRELNPEAITFLDPACGSGHILVEAYNVFKEIYLEHGYRTRDIPRLILEKNLYGLEIDDRAAQMACFALLMRARRDDRRILNQPPQLNIMVLQSSQGINAEEIANILGAEKRERIVGERTLFDDLERQPSLEIRQESGLTRDDIVDLTNLFEHAGIFGSLIQIPEALAAKLALISEAMKREGEGIFREILKPLEVVVRQARILAEKYDCVVTNPPYMGSKGMNGPLKNWAKEIYPNNKSDLFAMFIERGFGFSKSTTDIAYVTPYVWMFLSTYEQLRRGLLDDATITTLVQLEYNAFEPACIPVCTFSFNRYQLSKYLGNYIKLSEFRGHQNQEPKTLEAIKNPDCGWRYNACAVDLKKIPGAPIAYWVSNRVRSIFETYSPLYDTAPTKQGLATGDNDRFMRIWHEVSVGSIEFNGFSFNNNRLENKWYPCNKGGAFRKWYGNNTYIVNWNNNGQEIKSFIDERGKLKSRPQNQEYYFKEGLTWSALSSSSLSMRYSPPGMMFETKGAMCFPKNKISFENVLGYANTKIVNHFMLAMSPTLDFHEGPVGRLPYKPSVKVDELVKKCINISMTDWNSFETSWHFVVPPIIKLYGTESIPIVNLFSSYAQLREYWRTITLEIQQLEERNNLIFSEAYGLQDELTPDVPLKEITLTCNPHYRYGGDKTEEELEALLQLDTIKELISYAVGCMMGRYSLDEPGLIYAHSGNEGFDPSRYQRFPADEDGIVPILDQDWFPDDATHRLAEFLSVAWTPETLDENLRFVADTLGAKQGEASLDTIRRYMSTGFFKDHLKTYKKRPIYWLFSSGKLKAFECLVYLHRYNESTLSRMRSAYVTPLQGKYNARLEFLRIEADKAATASAQKKAQKEMDLLRKKQMELARFDEELRHFADQRLKLDLDDGVKVNYGRFGNLLAEVKAVTGEK